MATRTYKIKVNNLEGKEITMTVTVNDYNHGAGMKHYGGILSTSSYNDICTATLRGNIGAADRPNKELYFPVIDTYYRPPSNSGGGGLIEPGSVDTPSGREGGIVDIPTRPTNTGGGLVTPVGLTMMPDGVETTEGFGDEPAKVTEDEKSIDGPSPPPRNDIMTCPDPEGRTAVWYRISTSGVVSAMYESTMATAASPDSLAYSYPIVGPVTKRPGVDGSIGEVKKAQWNSGAFKLEIKTNGMGYNSYTLEATSSTAGVPSAKLPTEHRPNYPVVVPWDNGGAYKEVLINMDGYITFLPKLYPRFNNSDRNFTVGQSYKKTGTPVDYTSIAPSTLTTFFKIDKKSFRLFSTVMAHVDKKVPINLSAAQESDPVGTIYLAAAPTVNNKAVITVYKLTTAGAGGTITALYKYTQWYQVEEVTSYGYYIYLTLKHKNKLERSVELTALYTSKSGSRLANLDNMADKSSPSLFIPARTGRPYDLNTWDKYPAYDISTIPEPEDKKKIVLTTSILPQLYHYSFGSTINPAEIKVTMDKHNFNRITFSDVTLKVPTSTPLARKGTATIALTYEGNETVPNYTTLFKSFDSYVSSNFAAIYPYDAQLVPPSTGFDKILHQTVGAVQNANYIDKTSSAYTKMKAKVASDEAYMIFDDDLGDINVTSYICFPSKFSAGSRILKGRDEDGVTSHLRGEIYVYNVMADYIAFAIDMSTREMLEVSGKAVYMYKIKSVHDIAANRGLVAGYMLDGKRQRVFANYAGEAHLQYSVKQASAGGIQHHLNTIFRFRYDTDRHWEDVLVVVMVGLTILIGAVVCIGGNTLFPGVGTIACLKTYGFLSTNMIGYVTSWAISAALFFSPTAAIAVRSQGVYQHRPDHTIPVLSVKPVGKVLVETTTP